MSLRDAPTVAKTIAELRSLSDTELIEQHDELVTMNEARKGVSIDYYLSELNRRVAVAQGQKMERLTWWIALLTLVNVVAVVFSLLNG
jgi:hypothetical protein